VAVRLVIDKIAELGSVRQMLLWLIEHQLDLQTSRNNDEDVWSRMRYMTVYDMIANPATGGAYPDVRQTWQ
jgi:hypothetical protein